MVLQFLYHRFQLLTQANRIALRDPNDTIEGVRDGEYREEICIRKFHIINYLLTNRAILVNTKYDVVWQARELGDSELLGRLLILK